MHFLSSPITVSNEFFSEPSPLEGPKRQSDHIEYLEIGAKSDKWIELACNLATSSVENGGGPFGAVILQIDSKTNKILRYWESTNKVTIINDPTAHAEIMAIRSACSSLGVFNLGGIQKNESKLEQISRESYCAIYSSCEPCPMCFSAISWARIPLLCFAASRYDAAQPGIEFSDKEIYDELGKPYKDRKMKVCKCHTTNYLDAFELWKRSDHNHY